MMKINKKTIVGVCVLLVSCGAYIISLQKEPKVFLKLPDKDISLIVANTPADREHGLSDRESLPEDSGMLFVFDTPDTYGIWMKDMKFPLDILWLDAQKKIVHIEHAVSPDSYPDVFKSTDKSLYVLEVNGGFVEKNALFEGQNLLFSQKI